MYITNNSHIHKAITWCGMKREQVENAGHNGFKRKQSWRNLQDVEV